MKKLLFILSFIPLVLTGQTYRYGEIQNKNSKGNTYITKLGSTLKIGDKLTIGKPIGNSKDTFSYITQGGQPVVRSLENDEIVVLWLNLFIN